MGPSPSVSECQGSWPVQAQYLPIEISLWHTWVRCAVAVIISGFCGCRWLHAERPLLLATKQIGRCRLVINAARRDAEVLSLFAALINKLKQRMEAEVPQIFEAVFECTLQMITKNFEVCHAIAAASLLLC